MTAAPAYRTHLFSDLRGYTTLLEQAGNAAGAEMLNRYRLLVRSAIERYGGHEVSTEGDAFYIVFPSASSAVMCGLAMVEDAAVENETHPELPIRIGVGIHTGEVVETDNTFIGTAVNVAARVCAIARADEVLVTGTVRGITHGSVDLTFVSRGRKRLKGLAEPVEIFTVVPRGRPVPVARRISRRPALVVAAAFVVVIAVAGAVAFWPGQPVPTATPAPTQEQTAVVGTLGIGSYQSADLTPKIHFVVSDLGWSVYRETADALGLRYAFEPPGQLDIGRPGVVFVDPCAAGGDAVSAGRSAADFLAAAAGASYLHVPEAKPLNIGGRDGLTSDITLDPGAQAACGSLGGSGVTVFSLGGEPWSAQAGEVFRLVALDTDSGLLALIASSEEASATSVQALENFFKLADRLVASISF